MEELFICQRFDFIVDCVQKVCVALLYCWCNRINITKRFDSYRESFILLSPCKYFCIVCGECISSSIKKRIVCFLVFIKFYKFNIRIVICEICLCCCSFYNDQLLAFQIFYLFDQRIIMICFVPFDLKMPSLECINLKFNPDNSSNTFKSIINGMAIGTNLYYDPVELLNSGNIKRL